MMKRDLRTDMSCMKWSYDLNFVQRTAEGERNVKSLRYPIRENIRRSHICSGSMMMLMLTTTVRMVTMMKTDRLLLCGSVNSVHTF